MMPNHIGVFGRRGYSTLDRGIVWGDSRHLLYSCEGLDKHQLAHSPRSYLFDIGTRLETRTSSLVLKT